MRKLAIVPIVGEEEKVPILLDRPADRAHRSQAGFDPIRGWATEHKCDLSKAGRSFRHFSNVVYGAFKFEHREIRTGVAPGNYTLRVVLNPDLILAEEDYANNTSDIPVVIP